MSNLNGVHHLAITTRDMKGQLDFFCNVLGGELARPVLDARRRGRDPRLRPAQRPQLHRLRPAPGDQVPDPIFGVTHAGWGGSPTARGAMQHVAFNVDSLDDLLAIRDRIRSAACPCSARSTTGCASRCTSPGRTTSRSRWPRRRRRSTASTGSTPRSSRCAASTPRAGALKHPAPTKVHDTPVPQPAYDRVQAEHDLPQPRRTCGRSPRPTR